MFLPPKPRSLSSPPRTPTRPPRPTLRAFCRRVRPWRTWLMQALREEQQHANLVCGDCTYFWVNICVLFMPQRVRYRLTANSCGKSRCYRSLPHSRIDTWPQLTHCPSFSLAGFTLNASRLLLRRHADQALPQCIYSPSFSASIAGTCTPGELNSINIQPPSLDPR